MIAWLFAACAAAQAQAHYAGLAQAIDYHARFKSCFDTKLRTGTCSYGDHDGSVTTETKARWMARRAGERLALLGLYAPTAALVYHERGNGLLDIFLLDRTGLVASATVAAELDRLVDGVREELTINTRAATRAAVPLRRAEPAPPTEPVTLEALANALLPDGIRAGIIEGGYARILVLPSGPIAQAPFPALPIDATRLLVDQASVVMLPDLESLFLPVASGLDLETVSRAYTFSVYDALDGDKLFVGNPAFGTVEDWVLPQLPGAEAEVAAVAPLLGASRVLTGAAATKGAILSRLNGFRESGGIIYLATHGISDSVNPMDGSFLAVANDVIYANVIRKLGMRFKHPLVVMSACQSGLGKTFGGGGFGLARAWYAAGAGQVVGSLWNVDDEGTELLMRAFALHLSSRSLGTEDALRSAMLMLREYVPDPAVWASFVVFGNPSG